MILGPLLSKILPLSSHLPTPNVHTLLRMSKCYVSQISHYREAFKNKFNIFTNGGMAMLNLLKIGENQVSLIFNTLLSSSNLNSKRS